MRGMKSLVAPTKRQNFADGGVVGAIKGMFGIKPEDPERARRLAEYQANAAREKEAVKVATAPAPAPAPAISDYSGMGAMKRREKEQGLADGGRVRPRGFVSGPGTETSDSIPARLSDGEYVLPADTVRAVGVDKLDALRAATHTPARGFSGKDGPEFFFAGGSPGGVWEDDKKRLQNQTAMYVQGAQAAAAAAPATPAAPVPAAPAPVAKDPLDGGAAFGVFPQLAGGKRTTYAMDEKLRTGVEATGPSTFVQATPLDKTIIGGGNGQRMNATQDPRSLLTDTGMNAVAGVSPPPAPLPQGDAQPGSPAASASTVKPSEMGGNLPTPQSDATSTAIAPGIYQHGRGQYSDNASGMGFTSVPGSGGQGSPVGKTVEQAQREGLVGERVGYNPAYDQRLNGATGISAQNMAAADALAGRSQQESMNRVAARGMGALSGPGSGPVAPGSFTGGFSGVIGTDPAAGRERKAMVDALTTPMRGAQNGQLTSSQRQGMASLVEAERRDASSNRQADQTAATQQSIAAMREAGDNGRAFLREDGENTRFTARNQIDARRYNDGASARAVDMRAAQRRESAYDNYSKAKTDEDRQAIAKQFPDLFGQAKDAAHRMEVVRGKTDPMTGQSSGDYVVVQDPKTGGVRQIQMGAASAAPTQELPKAGEVRNGFRFKGGNPNDQANWTKV